MLKVVEVSILEYDYVRESPHIAATHIVDSGEICVNYGRV